MKEFGFKQRAGCLLLIALLFSSVTSLSRRLVEEKTIEHKRHEIAVSARDDSYKSKSDDRDHKEKPNPSKVKNPNKNQNGKAHKNQKNKKVKVVLEIAEKPIHSIRKELNAVKRSILDDSDEDSNESSDNSVSGKRPKHPVIKKQRERSRESLKDKERHRAALQVHDKKENVRQIENHHNTHKDIHSHNHNSLSHDLSNVKTTEGSIMFIHRTLNEKPQSHRHGHHEEKNEHQDEHHNHGHDQQKEHSKPSQICPATFEPVCSQSGMTYPNRCTLQRTANEKFAFYGFCNRKRNCKCPKVYSQVCGIDGKTYANKCAAKCAGVCLRHLGRCR